MGNSRKYGKSSCRKHCNFFKFHLSLLSNHIIYKKKTLKPLTSQEMKKEANKEVPHFSFHYTVLFLKLAYSSFKK
jgi:hypothetical protein